MLYLAEVQKQKGSLLGGAGKTELKLLACQRTDQSWSNVSEEVISAEEANKLNDGALVLVELNPQKQVQRVQEAGRPLVNILQNFSRQLEKFKVKEDEIDQWKESLTFQAQEFNRREMEMEARLEELQQMEEEFHRLEAEKQQFEALHQETEKLQAEIERKNQELEGAWEHLRGEQRRLEERQAEMQGGNVLDEEQGRILVDLIERLGSDRPSTDSVSEHLQYALEMVEQQQGILNPHWQQLEQQRTAVGEQQAEFDRLSQILSERQAEWQQIQKTLEEQATVLTTQTATLKMKEEWVELLKGQLQQQEELHQTMQSLLVSNDENSVSGVDLAALENMSLEELQTTIQDLQEKLRIDSSFVHDQEQELIYKQQTINELQEKINQVSDGERGELETEIADEKDSYQMLNETLVGQRRSITERKSLLKQHKMVLWRRQGQTPDDEGVNIDLSPALQELERQKEKLSVQLQAVMGEISQLQGNISQIQEHLTQQTPEQETKRQELQEMEDNLKSLRTAIAESWGRVNLYQEALQPIQDSLDGMRHKLQVVAENLTQVQNSGNSQQEMIAQMRETLMGLIAQPALAA
ncbi:pilus motility taxis protein HmpF [Calothrix sp. 336/3]|uniref:pilus motility taxis protein HmpF n=1 Tax=Calothrix sp. 336/3 TaxID=1337936 RepID=UPI0004E2DDB0|nr:pilus motility taxis protein HmpF [Calothrix sp. 336/3]AKG22473.1 hypothetical protein IJ00_15430 [Calothrix sp. 336/3]